MFCIFMHMPHDYATAPPDRLIVIKYGGNAMTDGGTDAILAEVATLWRSGTAVVLVHGGGPEIDRALARSGITTRRIDGLRVTDEPTLEVTEAVLCATLNKRIVRHLLGLGIAAVGISGQDGNTLTAEVDGSTGHDLGYVGRIIQTSTGLLRALLDAGYLPVVAPLAVATDFATALNVNADLSAGAIAGALRADAFVQITNVSGIYRDLTDPQSRFDRLGITEAQRFVASDGCQSSMKPKLRAAIDAVLKGARAAYVCAAGEGAIAQALLGEATVIA